MNSGLQNDLYVDRDTAPIYGNTLYLHDVTAMRNKKTPPPPQKKNSGSCYI